MIKIDVVQSAMMGYKTVWEERQYLLKLLWAPLFIKFVSTVILYVSIDDALEFRHAFIMIPSYFVQGWLVAQFLRTILTGERWPMRLSNPPAEKEIKFMLWRARGILACILCFVVISMAQTAAAIFMGGFKDIVETQPEIATSSSTIPMFMAAVAIMVFAVWGFRLFWLYIPLVILSPLKAFIHEIRGFKTSLYMIGIWLMIVIPITFVISLLSGIVGSIAQGASVTDFITIFIYVVGEVAIQIVTVTALAYALKDVLIKYGAKPIFIEPERPL